MLSDRRKSAFAAILLFCTLVVLLLKYISSMRVHQGWEDEIYWFSTCYSMIRHTGPTPSVLQDFPSPQSPLRFYGPILFWLGAAILKICGATMEGWRTYTFVGEMAFLGAIALLFRRLFQSWFSAAIAVFLFSLSMGSSFGVSLPGRPDGWGMATLVLAMVVVVPRPAQQETAADASLVRYLLFGVLCGLAATTSPRTWPLIFSMVVVLPLLIRQKRVARIAVALISILVTVTLVLLPLHLSPWGFLAYVSAASKGDAKDVSPLMGGSWGLGAARSQSFYYGTLLVMLGVVSTTTWWRRAPAFVRWLTVAGLLNLALTMLLVSGALRGPAYWAFPLEICVVAGLLTPIAARRRLVVRVLGCGLLAYMLILRTARELPVWLHWGQRDPAITERAIASAVPAGSLVYGPMGEYFYPTVASGSDYLYLRDWTTPGRSSVPGSVDSETRMVEACHQPAFLIWPAVESGGALPAPMHAAMSKVAEHRAEPQARGRLERAIESAPGGRSEQEDLSFTIYRLHMAADYCKAVGTRPAQP